MPCVLCLRLRDPLGRLSARELPHHRAAGFDDVMVLPVACADGLDDDGDTKTDYDAGLSKNGTADPDGPDPQCGGNPWGPREARRRCGLGFELALLVPAFSWLWRRRRSSVPGSDRAS